jgi:hypothetical protein
MKIQQFSGNWNGLVFFLEETFGNSPKVRKALDDLCKAGDGMTKEQINGVHDLVEAALKAQMEQVRYNVQQVLK